MNEPLQALLAPRLRRWIQLVLAHPRQFSSAGLVLTVAFFAYAFFNLGINSDNLSLVSDTLESRQNHARFAALFPNLEEALLVVVDGETPALARDATDALADRLSQQTGIFKRVYVPGGGAFFEEHALLYRSPEELDRFGDQLATLQPLLASLEADPSLVELAALLGSGLQSGQDSEGQKGIDPATWGRWVGLIDQIGLATISVYEEHPARLSWETLMLAA